LKSTGFQRNSPEAFFISPISFKTIVYNF
jgi:hypothetical protein